MFSMIIFAEVPEVNSFGCKMGYQVILQVDRSVEQEKSYRGWCIRCQNSSKNSLQLYGFSTMPICSRNNCEDGVKEGQRGYWVLKCHTTCSKTKIGNDTKAENKHITSFHFFFMLVDHIVFQQLIAKRISVKNHLLREGYIALYTWQNWWLKQINNASTTIPIVA